MKRITIVACLSAVLFPLLLMAQEPAFEGVNLLDDGDALLQMGIAFKGGEKAPKLDFDPSEKIREYLTRRVPDAAGKEKIHGSVSTKGAYSVPTGKTGGRTDPRVERPSPRNRRIAADWRPLNKEGVAVFVSYPIPIDGTPFSDRAKLLGVESMMEHYVVLLDLKGTVFGVVPAHQFLARKPGTPDAQLDDGQLDPFLPR